MFILLASATTLLIIIFYILIVFCVDVKIGPPPFKELVLAYKYLYLGKLNNEVLSELKRIFPKKKIVKLCYAGPKSQKLEFALGVNVGDEDWKQNKQLVGSLIQSGLAFFKTPSITNSLYSEYPIVHWLPLTKWIAVAVAYWKHFRYAQECNLCAYPVVEIYSTYKLLVFLPLLRQDEFVVEEAERIVFGRSYSAMLRPLTIIPKTAVLQKNLALTAGSSIAKQKGVKISKSFRETKG